MPQRCRVASVGAADEEHDVRPGVGGQRLPGSVPVRVREHADDDPAAGQRDPTAGLGGDEILLADHGDPESAAGRGTGADSCAVDLGVVDTQGAFPGLLLALLIFAAVGPSVHTVIIVLCLDGWLMYARVARGTVLSLREMPYVEAAELVGCRPRRVMARHIAPNLTSPILTVAVLEFARIILAEAVLSFLGLGVQPPQMSWGLEIAEGQDYVYSAWWLVTFPGIAIAVTVLGVNMFASWLRVAADPQEREKRFAASATALGGGAI